MYSPSWLYIIPGFAFLLTGAVLGVTLLFAPIQIANVVLDLNTFLVACFLAIAGVQLLTFGTLSRYYATKSGFLPSSARIDSFFRSVTTDRLIQMAGIVFAVGLAGFAYALWSWAKVDFGPLPDRLVPRVLMLGLTAMLIGIQTGFASFFFGIIDIGRRHKD